MKTPARAETGDSGALPARRDAYAARGAGQQRLERAEDGLGRVVAEDVLLREPAEPAVGRRLHRRRLVVVDGREEEDGVEAATQRDARARIVERAVEREQRRALLVAGVGARRLHARAGRRARLAHDEPRDGDA